MGIYSNNRVASVTESKIDQIDAMIESIDWTPDPNFGNLIEACTAIHENDAKMFDTLINLDFVSANEGVVMEAEEAKKANIIAKIKEFIDKAIEWVKKAVANTIAKIKEILDTDAKLVKKYEEVLKMENLKDFPGIKNFALPKEDVEKSIDYTKYVSVIGAFTGAVQNASEKTEVDAAKTTFESDLAELSKVDVVKLEAEDVWKPESSDLARIIKNMKDGSSIIVDLKKTAAKVISELKSLKSKASKDIKSSNEEFATYKANQIYIATSKGIKSLNKALSANINAQKQSLAAYRKAMWVCGMYAAKKAGKKVEEGEVAPNAEEVAAESALIELLGEASDAYVFECFAY